MDYFGYDKKRYIIVGGILVLIVIVTIALLINFNKDKENGKNIEDEEVSSNNENYNKEYIFENLFPQEEMGSEEVQIVIPTTLYGGTVGSFKNIGNTAELVLNIAGDSDNTKKFKYITGGIVFDVKRKKAIMPSELEEGDPVKIVSKGITYDDNTVSADTIIVNDDGIRYTEVSQITTVEQEIIVRDNRSDNNYIISPSTQIYNAMTGDVYTRDSLNQGDRLFLYADSSDKGLEVKELYVYPARNE